MVWELLVVCLELFEWAEVFVFLLTADFRCLPRPLFSFFSGLVLSECGEREREGKGGMGGGREDERREKGREGGNF